MAVQQLEMALGAEQRLMLVLSVDLHQALAHPRQGLHGGHLAVDVGARTAAVGGKRAADEQLALGGFGELLGALGQRRLALEFEHSFDDGFIWPARIISGEARPPSSSPSAVMMMVLPAPVSPESTLKPGPK